MLCCRFAPLPVTVYVCLYALNESRHDASLHRKVGCPLRLRVSPIQGSSERLGSGTQTRTGVSGI